jgi:protein-(glutamine-N5) methyltransferase, release factor-specific
MNYQKLLNHGDNFLKINKIKSSKIDSELLLSKVLKKNREEILTSLNNKIDEKQINEYSYYLFRRKKKEPIAYILGFKYFWKYFFYVNKSVLIPRPDTEHIVEEALNNISINQSINILDIGTGSGCVIISILNERRKCKATAIDISNKALKIAKTNAKLHHLENKIKFINMDIDKYNSNKYDLILSNPPYIKNIELSRLDDDIKFFEPKLALRGGLDGYSEIKKVIGKSSKLLRERGKLIIEIGNRQKEQTIIFLKKKNFYINKICKDLSGKDRCIISTKINK